MIDFPAPNHRQTPYVFLDSSASHGEDPESYVFTSPDDVLVFRTGDDVRDFFRRIDNMQRRGFWLAGFFAYEFGYELERAVVNGRRKSAEPLAWLIACRKPRRIRREMQPKSGPQRMIIQSAPRLTFGRYADDIRRIQTYLRQGLTYQVNHTFPLDIRVAQNPWDVYRVLRRVQPTAYSAFLQTGYMHVLSFSPELFFRIDKRQITVRPMKGTADRGLTAEDDARRAVQLSGNEKARAENLMIVDLMRNDIGRICDRVRTTRLFRVERHPTLLQMTSTVEGSLSSDTTWLDVFRALFPSGSVTGAPKIRTMQIISELERTPRGVYTGAIGFISPDGRACFNVAIRTIQMRGRTGRMGVGGGIVQDSQARDEYREALLKARFLQDAPGPAHLIETIRWERGRWRFLPAHIRRLRGSARYFSFPLDMATLRRTLTAFARRKCRTTDNLKVRISLGSDGRMRLSSERIRPTPTPVRVCLNPNRTDPDDVRIYHKTDGRALYDDALARARSAGCFDALFQNIRGEITEGAITNLFIRRRGRLYTPPLTSGVLPGILRGHLLQTGQATEKLMTWKDVLAADCVFVGNSVRGLLPAVPVTGYLPGKSQRVRSRGRNTIRKSARAPGAGSTARTS